MMENKTRLLSNEFQSNAACEQTCVLPRKLIKRVLKLSRCSSILLCQVPCIELLFWMNGKLFLGKGWTAIQHSTNQQTAFLKKKVGPALFVWFFFFFLPLEIEMRSFIFKNHWSIDSHSIFLSNYILMLLSMLSIKPRFRGLFLLNIC